MIKYEMMDQSKDHGRVYGSDKFMYEQDGKLFNAQFQRVDINGMIIEIEETLTKRAIPTGDPKKDDSAADVKPEVAKVVISGVVNQNQKNALGQDQRKKIVLPKRVANS